jgi:predicted MFS family arabinose efflux permease
VPAKNPVIVRAQGQLSQIFASKTLWMAVVMLFLVYTVPGLNTALVFQQSEVYKFDTEYIGFLGSVEGVVGIFAALAYGVVCRRFSLRTLIIGGVGLSGLTTYLYLFYGHDTAPFIHGAAGFFGVVAELCLMDLAVRSTPKGCEALGFSLMMSVRNFGLSMSDVIGTQIMDQFHVSFPTMVSVNATTTMVVLLFVPFLPRLVVGAKEGEKLAA